jgi:rubredoxin
MGMKLTERKPDKPPGKARRVTKCPECGSLRIEWKLTLEGGRHSYVCPDCGYSHAMVLEIDID